MAYRKTEKVLAELAARRTSILAAAMDVISKSGMEAFTADAIAERGKFSVGLIYKNFPDLTEVLAAVVQQLLSRDLAAIREAGGLERGIRAWARRLSSNYRLMAAIGAQPAYRAGIRAELAKMIRSAGAESPVILSAVAYGAVYEIAGSLRPRDEGALTACLLRAFGVRTREAA